MESVWVTGWFLRLMKQITALQMAGTTSSDSAPQVSNVACRGTLAAGCVSCRCWNLVRAAGAPCSAFRPEGSDPCFCRPPCV